MNKIYRQIELTDEEHDDFVFPHIMAMTGEKLHSKAEIAYELGVRDRRIVELQQDNKGLQLRIKKQKEVIFERHKQITELKQKLLNMALLVCDANECEQNSDKQDEILEELLHTSLDILGRTDS
jgi:hypothetical protein